MSFGDAKLFAAAGAWQGWQALPLVLAGASLAGLAFALLTSRIRPNARLAFGLWISLEILLHWLAAA